MSSYKTELLINVRSRSGRQVKEQVLRALKANNIEISKVNEVNRNQSIPDALKNILKRKPKLLVVGGGDGTITEVVDHLVGSPIEIGIIPLGTTNNFARSLNLPLEIELAIKTIAESTARKVDVGEIDGDYFTNVTGVGLSARLASSITNKSKKRWGRAAYAFTGFKLFITHKPFMVTLEDSEQKLKVNFETHQLIIANGRYHAGRQIAEDVKLDNRELVIFALGGRSKFNFAWHMIDFYLGKRKKVEHSSYLIGTDVRISTNSPQPVELDGEVKYKTPINARVVPRALNIRYKT